MAQVSSLYPTDQLYAGEVVYNVNEIKKYQFPDCMISYFNYFEKWTPRLTEEERKILLNRLLQDDDIAFGIYMENAGEPYEVLKNRLIEHFSECGESLLKDKKEKRKRRRMFKKMTKDEMENYVRTTYNELNSLSKERLIIKELTRLLPRKFKRLELENKCNSIDQVVEKLGEKFNKMKLKNHSGEGAKKKMKKTHGKHGSSTSSSSSSSSSEDEKCKKKGHIHHHKRHGKDHHGKDHHGKDHHGKDHHDKDHHGQGKEFGGFLN